MTVPTPSPARNVTPAPGAPSRTVATMSAPCVTSGSSPASLTMPAVAQPSSFPACQRQRKARPLAARQRHFDRIGKFAGDKRGKCRLRRRRGAGAGGPASAQWAFLPLHAASPLVRRAATSPRERDPHDRLGLIGGRARAAFRSSMPGHVWLAGAGPGRSRAADARCARRPAAGRRDRLRRAGRCSACWRSPAGRRCSNSPASAAASPQRRRPTSAERLIALARAAGACCGSRAAIRSCSGAAARRALALAAAGIPFRVIPGVTAGLAALAAASIPATLRGINRAVIFAAGHGADEDFDWAPLARTGAADRALHGDAQSRAHRRALMAGRSRRSTPAAVIASTATPAGARPHFDAGQARRRRRANKDSSRRRSS